MKFTYLDKKDRVHAWLGSRQSLYLASAALIFLSLPLWRQTTVARFVLEPVNSATLRASVPGIVDAVYASEGAVVQAGEPIARLRNVPLQSKLDLSDAEYRVAAMRAASAEYRYKNVGDSIQQREQAAQQRRNLSSQGAGLILSSPVSGTVLTARIEDKLGAYLLQGTVFADVADLSVMRARIYVSEYEVGKIRTGANARVAVDGVARKWDAQASDLAPASTANDPSLIEYSKYKGLVAPNFYAVQLQIPNADGVLKPGMRGTARIYGNRESLAGFAWEIISHFFGRKLW